jgi:hypothetical protein
VVADSHDHAVDATIVTVAKGKLATAPAECWIVANALAGAWRPEDGKR